MVQSVGNCTAQTKGKSHSKCANAQRDPPVACHIAQVDFQAHEKQEENQTDIGNERKIWNRGWREDVSSETRNMAANRRPEEHATEDFCNDFGLSYSRERNVQQPAEDDDDARLGTN